MHTIAERKPTTERILAAALEVFSREGMNATTREIARVAEVNEATLFRQFETKGQLLIAVTKEVKRLQARRWPALILTTSICAAILLT